MSGLEPKDDRGLERKHLLQAGKTRTGLKKLSSKGSLGGWRRSQLDKGKKFRRVRVEKPLASSKGGPSG